MTEIDLVKQWLQHAYNDLLVAQQCVEKMRPQQTEIACYLCQQCAEKALKGFLVFHKIDPPKIHNLIQLCQSCADIDENFSRILNFCSNLTSFAVIPRYPNELAPNEDIASSAIASAQKIYEFCASNVCKGG
ncbi:MAG: HEPN domain-containing protein [Candidatus Margulisbacteria bacterium]|jgi:HEPN domain-containing protein|nr:HEPN domain-containing protein [Candidatus Margulisiibacteriota bacterium]